MKKALIEPGLRIAQVVVHAFQVAPPLAWVDCPNEVTTEWTFDGENFIPPPTPGVEELKHRKRDEINAIRDELETAGFLYNDVLFDSDQRSTDRIQIATLAAQSSILASAPFSIDWTTADNSTMTLDAAGMIGVANAFAVYGATLHAIAKSLKDQVDLIDVETVEELTPLLNAIQWPDP